MKVGLIVECAPGGMESTICPKIVQLLGRLASIPVTATIRPMTNKKQLLLRGAEAARLLLSTGCDRVVILWDENPPWTPQKDLAEKRCWHVERDHLLTELERVGVDRRNVGLVCVEREFETWLLHDLDLVRRVLRRGSRQRRIKLPNDPLTVESPKRFLSRLLSSRFGQRFNREVAAINFNRHLMTLEQLQRCDTFRYFAQSALGHMPKGWKPYVYTRKGPTK